MTFAGVKTPFRAPFPKVGFCASEMRESYIQEKHDFITATFLNVVLLTAPFTYLLEWELQKLSNVKSSLYIIYSIDFCSFIESKILKVRQVIGNLVHLVGFALSSANTPSHIYNANFKNSVT